MGRRCVLHAPRLVLVTLLAHLTRRGGTMDFMTLHAALMLDGASAEHQRGFMLMAVHTIVGCRHPCVRKMAAGARLVLQSRRFRPSSVNLGLRMALDAAFYRKRKRRVLFVAFFAQRMFRRQPSRALNPMAAGALLRAGDLRPVLVGLVAQFTIDAAVQVRLAEYACGNLTDSSCRRSVGIAVTGKTALYRKQLPAGFRGREVVTRKALRPDIFADYAGVQVRFLVAR